MMMIMKFHRMRRAAVILRVSTTANHGFFNEYIFGTNSFLVERKTRRFNYRAILKLKRLCELVLESIGENNFGVSSSVSN